MTKEDLAFIRALRNQGVEVTFSQPPQMQEGGRENYAVTDPKRILFDPSYTTPSEPKTFSDKVYDRFVERGQSNSQLENLYEFFDITGISSYDDAAAAYDQWNRSGRTYPTIEEGVDMFGAVPVLGKLGRLKYLNPNTIKKSYKNIPWQEIVNKADALQDMYDDDTTKDLPVSAVPELQGGLVEATAADSSAVAASSQALLDYYKNYTLVDPYLNPLPQESMFDPEAYDNTLSFRGLDIAADRMQKDLAGEYRDKPKYPETYRSRMQGIGRFEGDTSFTYNDYRQDIDSNKFKQREVQRGIIDERAPMALYDRRIFPQGEVNFKNEIIDNQGNYDMLYDDVATVVMYDPIAVTPWNQLTPEQKKVRLDKYGTSGTPMDPNKIKRSSTPTRPASFTPIPARLTTQALSDQLMSQTINNDLTAPIPQKSIIKDLPVLTPKASPIKAETSFTAKGSPMIDAKNRTTTPVPEGEVWNEKRGWHRKMQEGGMEQQRFSKEDLAFIRALRDRGVEVTFSGYKNDSPDKNNAANLIPSGNITMENVDKPVFAMDSKGNSTVMQPGENYKFPGNAVLEIPMMQLGGPESNSISNLLDAQDAALANDADFQSYGNEADVNDMGGAGFNMNTLMAVGSGVSQISNSLAQLGPESSTEVGSVSGMGGSREQAVEGTIGGTLSSIPIVGQFYQIGSGIGSGFEAGANALYAEGNTAGGEAMTAMQGIFDPASQFGRNAELWEAGYISDAQAVGGLFGGVIFGGAAGMDRRVREIADRQYKGAMTRATGGMHIAGTPSAESAGKFSKATGYPKPKRT